jgi:hypothetical protein
MWHGVAQLLEGACAALTDAATVSQIPPDLREKLRAAARDLSARLGPDSAPDRH